MAEKAEYRSARRSRRLIREAYLKLLKEKPESKITVTDIITLADVNRTTFYAHYPNIEGVIREIEDDVIEKMMGLLKEFHYFSFFKNPAPLLLQICRFIEEDLDLYKELIQTDSSDMFLEKLKRIFSNYMLNDQEIPKGIREKKSFAIRVCYFTGGIVNTFKQWLLGKLDCSLNDIAMEVSLLITQVNLS